MYTAIIGNTTHKDISWPSIYALIEPMFKTAKQKKRFKGFKIVSNLTRELVDDGGVWQPLGNICISSAG